MAFYTKEGLLGGVSIDSAYNGKSAEEIKKEISEKTGIDVNDIQYALHYTAIGSDNTGAQGWADSGVSDLKFIVNNTSIKGTGATTTDSSNVSSIMQQLYANSQNETGSTHENQYPQGWNKLDGCGGWGTTSGTGIQGVFTNGDKEYNVYCQGAGAWSNTSINEPSRNIANAGCGITSVSTVLSGLGYDVDPNDFAGQRSAGDQFVEQHLSEYGVSYKKMSSKEEMIEELKKGNPVVYHVNNGTVGDKYYSGHYVSLLGVNENDQIFLADPGSTHNSGYFDASKFTGMTSAYAVAKDEKDL